MTTKKKHGPLALGPQRTFTGEALRTIRFPLGGIGTGCVSLTGRGMLTDWELFNRPNYNVHLLRTFPAIWAKEKGHDPQARILAAPPQRPYEWPLDTDLGLGMPHLDGAVFRGEYPFAWIDFASKALPLDVSLEAYNPLIPSEPDDSGYPAAILRYTLTNKRKNPVEAVVMWSLYNAVGSPNGRPSKEQGGNVNTAVDEDGLRGLSFTTQKHGPENPRFGSMALLTPEKSAQIMTHWLRAGAWTPMHDFWNEFGKTGKFPEHAYGPSEDGQSDPGALGVRLRLQPGQTKTVTFYFTWHFPNFEKYWGEAPCCEGGGDCGKPGRAVWRNYYASQFDSALDAAKKLHAHEKRLYERSKTFHEALHGSTLPPLIVEAVSSQLSTLKSPTCLRLEDGTFYGWEGCSARHGCCEGSCTHVWNYQQALPFIFPSLERSMRTAHFDHNNYAPGLWGFRLGLPLGTGPFSEHSAADGQMGDLIKLYRDWKISGDDAWLGSLWPLAQPALEGAWVNWDADRDGVMEGAQHNTYDISFHGPNPLMQSMYLAALEAGIQLAEHFGDAEAAQTYRAIQTKGRRYVEESLYNGEYFEQEYEQGDSLEQQHGKGCLSDQVLGQWMARVAGLDYSIAPRLVRSALRAVFKHNWKATLTEHENPQRIYALQNEPGLLLCSWPRGGRPAIPFRYSDEVWTGIEYQVASHLILEGMVKEGVQVAAGVRQRHDGVARNPWNEFECGNHYARAMSSYGLLLALSGFNYDAGSGVLGFAPKMPGDRFRTFWALDGAWGTYEETLKQATLSVLHGGFDLRRLELASFAKAAKVSAQIGQRKPAVELEDGAAVFKKTVRLKAKGKLVLRFSMG